jgi:glutathione S-transferase
MFWTAINVGKTCTKYDIKAPVTSGHEMFDRAYRIQMNTLESALLLFPSIWIYAGLVGDLCAGVSGAIWITGRMWYGKLLISLVYRIADFYYFVTSITSGGNSPR